MDPYAVVAKNFMVHKGYPDAEPSDVYDVEDQKCKYFTYELPEGTLELEVWWQGDWKARVSTFQTHDSNRNAG